ncbi:MAG: hypothetical protein A4E45_00914 [Methanosaeta sp. PtaB.Bin039]|nr:MAG: hypothetical protein A4E45_00914 [Methanosaeta sp. PtaB.Bin039]
MLPMDGRPPRSEKYSPSFDMADDVPTTWPEAPRMRTASAYVVENTTSLVAGMGILTVLLAASITTSSLSAPARISSVLARSARSILPSALASASCVGGAAPASISRRAFTSSWSSVLSMLAFPKTMRTGSELATAGAKSARRAKKTAQAKSGLI